MKRIIIFSCLGILFLLGLVSTTVFAVLYINSQNELKLKDTSLALCNSQKSQDSCVEEEDISESLEYTFTDDGQDISITYPTTWTGILTTTISPEFAYEPVYGRIATGYEYNLTKSGVNLKFQKLMGAVDGFPSGLSSTEHDWAEVSGTNILRFSSKGENNWRYAEIIDCSTLVDGPFFTAEELASFDVCIGSFFPGFGNLGANIVTIQTSNSTLLLEADLIVKSALN